MGRRFESCRAHHDSKALIRFQQVPVWAPPGTQKASTPCLLKLKPRTFSALQPSAKVKLTGCSSCFRCIGDALQMPLALDEGDESYQPESNEDDFHFSSSLLLTR